MLGRALVLLVSAGTIFAAAGWGYVYASADEELVFGPQAGSFVKQSRPAFHMAWDDVPGVVPDSMDVFVDGVPVKGQVETTVSGIRVTPTAPLSDGWHDIRLQGRFTVFNVPRVVEKSFSLAVDTVKPVLRANQGRWLFATSRTSDIVHGYTEPGARVSARAASAQADALVGEDGVFTVQVSGLERGQWMNIWSTDAAGNTTKVSVKVVLDEKPPRLELASPANGEVIREGAYRISAVASDAGSFMRAGELRLDGKLVAAARTRDKPLGVMRLKSEEIGKVRDGRHQLEVRFEDGAGNALRRKLTYRTDTRRIIVNIAERRLYLYREGKVWKTYPVAVGTASHPTPTGDWETTVKRYRPTWVNPGQGWSASMPASIPPGPGNPLGTRAINLSASGIRIHGTYQSGSIGTAASHGCIRMHLADVEELYELVDVGMPVRII